jgi:hypothetical protein
VVGKVAGSAGNGLCEWVIGARVRAEEPFHGVAELGVVATHLIEVCGTLRGLEINDLEENPFDLLPARIAHETKLQPRSTSGKLAGLSGRRVPPSALRSGTQNLGRGFRERWRMAPNQFQLPERRPGLGHAEPRS